PIYFATHGPQVTRLAGEIADGVLIANTMVPAAGDHYLEQVRAGAAKAGRDPAAIDVHLRPEMCIDDDEAAAREARRPLVAARPGRAVGAVLKAFAEIVAPRLGGH